MSTDGTVATLAGRGTLSGSTSDGRPATEAKLYFVCAGPAVDGAGNLFISDCNEGSVHKIDANGIITTVAKLSQAPSGVAVDWAGNLLIATSGFEGRDGDRILKMSPDGILTTIAGSGSKGYSGDGGPPPTRN